MHLFQTYLKLMGFRETLKISSTLKLYNQVTGKLNVENSETRKNS